MFYAGAPMVTRAHAYRTCDWAGATSMVDQFMAGYSSAPAQSPSAQEHR
jgi:4-hydroxyphenylacetate 3-monooxygenase